jgi:hypothetical protein
MNAKILNRVPLLICAAAVPAFGQLSQPVNSPNQVPQGGGLLSNHALAAPFNPAQTQTLARGGPKSIEDLGPNHRLWRSPQTEQKAPQ